MSESFSTKDLERIAAVIRTLTSPLAHPTVDAWRLATNRELKDLFGCSSAGFLLPGTSMPMFSEEHDQDELAGFPDLVPPDLLDGTPIWKRMIDLGVCTLESAYGAEQIQRYYGSPYYQEYASPNRARETMAACIAVSGFGPGGAASLHLWNDRNPNPPRFSDRDLAVLSVLFPAFQAGVRVHLQTNELRRDFHGLIDRLNVAMMVCDECGRVVHETPALSRLLFDEPEAANVRAAVVAAAAPERSFLELATREFRTESAWYRLSAFHHRLAEDRPLKLLMLECLTPRRRTAADLQAEFGLTPAEARVALLVGLGHTNASIAETLRIASSTARHHTERVFLKLGVRSRAQVSARLLMEPGTK